MLIIILQAGATHSGVHHAWWLVLENFVLTFLDFVSKLALVWGLTEIIIKLR